MTKAEIEKKRSLARTLFMSGMEQAEIAEKIGVSRVTISKWCVADGWKEARAAKSVTRPELVNKLLLTIDDIIEVSMKFSKWLEFRAKSDPTITTELMKTINHLQDLFIMEQMGVK